MLQNYSWQSCKNFSTLQKNCCRKLPGLPSMGPSQGPLAASFNLLANFEGSSESRKSRKLDMKIRYYTFFYVLLIWYWMCVKIVAEPPLLLIFLPWHRVWSNKLCMVAMCSSVCCSKLLSHLYREHITLSILASTTETNRFEKMNAQGC